MYRTTLHRLTRSLVVAAVAGLSACVNEAPVGPERGTALAGRLGAGDAPLAARRGPELGDCDHLRAPEGSRLVARLYAAGDQNYRWNGTSWAFIGPSAVLYSDAANHDRVGTHYSGPVWESVDGSTVRGSVPVACVVNADAIPWLRLVGTPGATSGIFGRVTSIQRVNTVGGTMPVEPGTFVDEVKPVSYTAEYFFYRTQ